MSHLLSADAVAFGSGDPTVAAGFESYKNSEFDNLKKYYYAVLMHGGKASAEVAGSLDPFEFAPLLKKYHENYGKGRAVLLISCWVGWAFARPLARASQLPILAGLSKVSFTIQTHKGGFRRGLSAFNKQQLETDDLRTGENSSNIRFRAEWVFNHPNGQIEALPGGNFLDQEAAIQVAKKYVKN